MRNVADGQSNGYIWLVNEYAELVYVHYANTAPSDQLGR